MNCCASLRPCRHSDREDVSGMGELTTACRLILAVWLGLPGLLKLRDPRAFRRSVHHYHILPRPLATVYAATVPPLEVAIAIMLVVGVAVGLGGALSIMILVSFACAVATNMRRGRDLDCHCFGKVLPVGIGVHTLVVDLLLLLPASGLVWNSMPTGSLLAFAWPITGIAPTGREIVLGMSYTLVVGLCSMPWMMRRRPVTSILEK